MKINPVNPATTLVGKTESLNSKKISPATKTEKAAETEQFIAGNTRPEKVITYHKQTAQADRSTIARLQAESEKAFASLRRIVTELLARQGYSAEQAKEARPAYPPAIEIDETARTEAAQLIAADGPWGAEAVSNRIVDFAVAISGGDKSKLPEIRKAIEQGFGQAKNILGTLPDLSLQTYDLVMEKLDRWENGET
ncbi:MAG: hypothetical protein GX334_00920 [Firmicutes bacterium]|nr:hypothetical protein [Bacillota bacterium]